MGESRGMQEGGHAETLRSRALDAAQALRDSAFKLSPGLMLPSPHISDSLTVALGQPPPPNTEKREKSVKVPESVLQAAAAISNARSVAPARLLSASLALKAGIVPRGIGGGVSEELLPPPVAAPLDDGFPVQDAASFLAVALPQAEFTYIDRPWEHFVRRWAAIASELKHIFPDGSFSMIDLGSCCGFFSLQAAAAFPKSAVIGVEGSVGIGNGTRGIEGDENVIIATEAIQTHLRWIKNLSLANCFVAPEVWTYQRVARLASVGVPICHVMLSLSVVHHIDNVSEEQYAAAGLSRVDGTLQLIAKLLDLATCHFIELPDKPWLEHMHKAFGTARRILEEAASLTGRRWQFTGPLCHLAWYGKREVWLLEDLERGKAPLPKAGLRSIFSRLLGSDASAGGKPGVKAVSVNAASSSSASGGAKKQQPKPQVAQPPAASSGAAVASSASAAASHTAAAVAPAEGIAGATPSLSAASRALSQEHLGAIMLSAPTALIAAHVHLREQLAAAEDLMRDLEAIDVATQARTSQAAAQLEASKKQPQQQVHKTASSPVVPAVA